MRQSLRDPDTITAEMRLRLYLDALDAPVASLGANSRSDWRSEAECHLRSLIAAFEELGDSHEDAVRQALARFGDAPTHGQATGTMMRRQLRRQSASARLFDTISAAFGPSLLPLGPFVAFAILYDRDAPGQGVCWVLTQFACLLAPVLTGWTLAGQNGATLVDLRAAMAERRQSKAAWCVVSLFLLVALLHPGLEWTVLRQLSGDSSFTNCLDWRAALVWPVVALAVAGLRIRVVTKKRAMIG